MESSCAVISHNGAASWSTRFLILSRSPFSLTTSTLRPSSCSSSLVMAGMLEKSTAWQQVHQEVDVAGVIAVASGNRTEYSEVACPVSRHDSQYILAFLLDNLSQIHYLYPRHFLNAGHVKRLFFFFSPSPTAR